MSDLLGSFSCLFSPFQLWLSFLISIVDVTVTQVRNWFCNFRSVSLLSFSDKDDSKRFWAELHGPMSEVVIFWVPLGLYSANLDRSHRLEEKGTIRQLKAANGIGLEPTP